MAHTTPQHEMFDFYTTSQGTPCASIAQAFLTGDLSLRKGKAEQKISCSCASRALHFLVENNRILPNAYYLTFKNDSAGFSQSGMLCNIAFDLAILWVPQQSNASNQPYAVYLLTHACSASLPQASIISYAAYTVMAKQIALLYCFKCALIMVLLQFLI